MRKRKSGPPVFTSAQGRWSIGSEVIAFWWEQRTDPEDGSVCQAQMHDVAIVTRLHREGDGTGPRPWWATVTFGPVWDLLRPVVYDPAELLAAAPYDPENALKAWEGNGRR